MQINISVRHGHLNEETQDKIRHKVEKIQRIFERVTSIDVTVDLANEHQPNVEINVSAEHKNDFVAAVSDTTLWNAVDSSLHKIEQQVRKYKEKIQDHHRTPARGVDLPEPTEITVE